MATLLLANAGCMCSKPLQQRQRTFGNSCGQLPSLQGFRSAPLKQREASGVCHMKKDLHPEYHEESKVYCNGEEVLVTSGTQPSYTVDIWSGNHPFFKGSGSTVVLDEGRVNRFKRRYAGMDSITDMSTIKQGASNEVDLSAFKKSQNKGKKGKGKK